MGAVASPYRRAEGRKACKQNFGAVRNNGEVDIRCNPYSQAKSGYYTRIDECHVKPMAPRTRQGGWRQKRGDYQQNGHRAMSRNIAQTPQRARQSGQLTSAEREEAQKTDALTENRRRERGRRSRLLLRAKYNGERHLSCLHHRGSEWHRHQILARIANHQAPG